MSGTEITHCADLLEIVGAIVIHKSVIIIIITVLLLRNRVVTGVEKGEALSRDACRAHGTSSRSVKRLAVPANAYCCFQ